LRKLPAGTFSYTDPYAGFDPIQQNVVDGSGPRASPDDGTVTHVYDREQFECAWIPASGASSTSTDPPAGLHPT
jgi:hypothetical protein